MATAGARASLTRSFSSQDLDDVKASADSSHLSTSFLGHLVDLESDSDDEMFQQRCIRVRVFEFEIEQRCIKAKQLAATAEAMVRRLPESRNLEKLKTKLTDHSCRCLQYATHWRRCWLRHVGFTTQRSYFEAALFKAALDFYEIEGEFNALKSFVDRYAVPDKDDMLEEASEDDEGDEGLDEDSKAKEASTKKAMKAMKEGLDEDSKAKEASTKKAVKAMKASTKKAMKAMKASTKKAMKAMKASTKNPAKTMKAMKASMVAKAKPKS